MCEGPLIFLNYAIFNHTTTMLIRFILNNTNIATDLPPGMVMLDFIRYRQQLTGTKIGCREGDCGACTVLVGELHEAGIRYESMTSCLLPIGNAEGKHIVTVEGVNMEHLNPVQEAMAAEGATQCGFCTPGFVMSLAGFCLSESTPTLQHALAAIDGNICRCTGYKSIERAASKLVTLLKDRKEEPVLSFVTRKKIIPSYFSGIPERLEQIRQTKKLWHATDPATKENRLRIVGGGTDLYVQQHDEMTHATIQFLFDHPELNHILRKDNDYVIGPSVTVSDLKNSALINELFPSFPKYAKLVSSTPIRNMATIAGNFINASPIGDFTIFFLALDAQLTLNDGTNKRILPLRKLYRGYKALDKKPEEYIEEIRFALPVGQTLFHFEKVSKRTHLDIASVNTAIFLQMAGNIIREAGISAGGVGPVPLYLEKTSSFLSGKPVNDETIRGAIEMMKKEISPISDARGTAAYKQLLLGQLIKAHFGTLFPEKALNLV